MATAALLGHGCVLEWNAQPIAEITSLGGPSIRIDSIDVTNHDSLYKFREFIVGLGDGGEISLEFNFIPGDTPGQIAFINDARARTPRSVALTLPPDAATEWNFDGFVTALDFDDPIDNQLSGSATIKITGKPELNVTLSTGMSGLTGIEDNVGAALTFVPAFAIGTFTYGVVVNALSDWVKLTPTAASHTITITVGSASQVIASGAQSGELALGAADSVTLITVKVQETGKVAKTYSIYVTRPA